tara:strand:- start:667 stop:1458 length:792 start_codon:yes stop_codon:yes gene_type:complete
MGLLSGKFLRDVGIGFGEGFLEKRQQARDNIVEYQERALNKYNNLQSKYDEGYKSRQQNAKAFKKLATNLGSSYLPLLNSFAQQGNDLESLASLEDVDQVRKNLDEMNLKPTDTSYLQTLKEEDKLQSETLNKNLNNYLGIFDNTANVFTKGIVEEGMAGIREDVGPIQTQDLGSTTISVGKGLQTMDKGLQNYVLQAVGSAGFLEKKRIGAEIGKTAEEVTNADLINYHTNVYKDVMNIFNPQAESSQEYLDRIQKEQNLGG